MSKQLIDEARERAPYGRGSGALLLRLADALETAEAKYAARTDRMRRVEVRALEAEVKLQRVQEAVDRHPVCDRYTEDGVISCGWQSAFADVRHAIGAIGETNVEDN